MIKPFVFAVLTAFSLTAVSISAATAQTPRFADLVRFAKVIDNMDDREARMDGDSIVVATSGMNSAVSVVRSSSGDEFRLVVAGTTRTIDERTADALCAGYLDHASVGSLLIDVDGGRWELSHRFDAARTSNDEFVMLFTRFTLAADSIAAKFASEMTSDAW